MVDTTGSGPDQEHPKTGRPAANRTSSTLLDNVNFERKNKPQPRLPPNHKIQKRPITHPPIAAPYAGSEVQKVVYVSRQTPIMAAVKRVKKLLEQAEKRSLQREGVLGTRKRAGTLVAAAEAKNRPEQEVILVKGSGRAINQAAKVGEWFKRHAEDGDGGWVVNVRPASVKVIDDIIPPSKVDDDLQPENGQNDDTPEPGSPQQDAAGFDVIRTQDEGGGNKLLVSDVPSKDDNQPLQAGGSAPEQKRPTFKKRKRPMYDENDVPEARTRYIHAIEIAISLNV